MGVEFSEAVFGAILDGIRIGESVATICARHDMPSQDSFYRWIRERDDLAERYTHAREIQAEYYADEIIEIADTCEDVQKARLRVDARKWKASKLAPKRYGDKVAHEHSGKDGKAVQVEMEVNVDADAFASRMARLAAAGSDGEGDGES